MEKEPPKDRFNLIYFVMLLSGIASITPWNVFINSKTYYEDYKLDQGNQSSSALRDYRTNFLTYVGMAAMWPHFLMNILNLFGQWFCCKRGARVVTSIIIMVAMLLFSLVLVIVDTSEWPETFFWVTIVTVGITHGVAGVYLNTFFGIAAPLPMNYTNALVMGTNLSGLLMSIANIITIASTPSNRTATVCFFSFAIVILMIALDLFFLSGHSAFYRYYLALAKMEVQKSKEEAKHQQPLIKVVLLNFRRIAGQIWHLMLGIWIVNFVTLVLFPPVMSDIEPLQIKMDDDYWVAIFCFLFNNLFSTFGACAAHFVRWPSPRWVLLPTLLRLLFLPLMMFMNFRPELRTLPVYIDHDAVYIISVVLMSFTNGYYSSLIMMYGPKQVSVSDAPIAGMIMSLCLVFGIVAGVNVSRVWEVIIE